MQLSDAGLDELHNLALDTASRAAALVRSMAGRARDVRRKTGAGESEAAQVVTEVDIASQRLIVDALAPTRERYGLGLLAEETADDASRHRCDAFWCVDPLDGTLPFVEGVRGYSVSLALVDRAGRPLLGVVADPIGGDVWHAVRGRGARRGNVALHVPTERREVTAVMDRSFHQMPDFPDWLARLEAAAYDAGMGGPLRTLVQGGAAMNACWVVENAPALYLKLPKPTAGGGAIWDFAATACLFGELPGAHASDALGGALDLNRRDSPFMNHRGVLYASHQNLAAAVLSAVRHALPAPQS